MYVAVNRKKMITAVSEKPFDITGYTTVQLPDNLPPSQWSKLIGTKLPGERKKPDQLKVAFICNWNEQCGISTYSRFLVEAMLPKVKELRVFSEKVPPGEKPAIPDEDFVHRCWQRGESMMSCIDEINKWEPDYVIVQHEFGLFPKATYFLQMLQGLDDLPYVVTTHSVYEHRDKTVCTSAIKNIVVHSEEAKEVLRKLGNNSRIFVVPHGCVHFKKEDTTELWNIFQTPYALMQFGFGFFYKGVDRVLDAIHHLKKSDKKFQNIFYCYLCSDNVHTSLVHTQYYDFLLQKIKDLDLQDNAVIVKKFQTEETINAYLRTAKIAMFPYVGDPKNMVYGASGAIRVAMANGIPVIASNCHQFDDLEGVVPRPGDYVQLAREIDLIFSNGQHRTQLLEKSNKYLHENSWPVSADRYINLYYEMIS
jgi:glycosyltransferase involved in cell wall biosynthesis